MNYYMCLKFNKLLAVYILLYIMILAPTCKAITFTREKNDGCIQFICGTDFEPICGSDGQTYPNSCNYNNAKCIEPTLTISQPGVCDDVGSAPSETGNPPTTDVCGIIEECDMGLHEPICGSNGVEYYNDCFFTVAYCKNTSLTVANKGKCVETVCNCFQSNPTVVEEKCVDKICPFEEDALCASNLKTYRNDCEFNQAKCYIKDLKVQYKGKCDSKSEVVEGMHPKCEWNCETTSRRVCGTDGTTYKNMCEFEKGQCINKALKVYRFEPC